MPLIAKILVSPDVISYIEKRGLTKQFDKAISYIESWYQQSTHLKLRRPKKDWVRYFRINQQFRALCTIEGNALFVDAVDNHQ